MRTAPERLNRNNNDRFEELALVHSGFMLNFARRLTRNETHAEDLFQDTYFKAYKSFETFDGGPRCRAWLKRIMINTYINTYNRKQKIIFYNQLDDLLEQVPARASKIGPDVYKLDQDSILRNYVSDEVRKSLMLLPNSSRTVVIFYDMLGLTYKEIARKIKVPMGTIKSRLFRGRAALRGILRGPYSNYMN